MESAGPLPGLECEGDLVLAHDPEGQMAAQGKRYGLDGRSMDMLNLLFPRPAPLLEAPWI